MSRPTSRGGVYVSPHAFIRFTQRIWGIPVRTLEAALVAKPNVKRHVVWLTHQAKPLPKEAHMVFARLLQEEADDLKRVEKGSLVYLHHPNEPQAVFVKSGDAIVTTLVAGEVELEWLLGAEYLQGEVSGKPMHAKVKFDPAEFFRRHGLDPSWAEHASNACEALGSEHIGPWKGLGKMANVEYFLLEKANPVCPYPLWEWKRAFLLGERLVGQRPQRVYTTPGHVPVLDMAVSGIANVEPVMLKIDGAGEVDPSQLLEIVAPTGGDLVCVVADQGVLQGLLSQVRRIIGSSEKRPLDFRHVKGCRIDPTKPPEQAFTFFSSI